MLLPTGRHRVTEFALVCTTDCDVMQDTFCHVDLSRWRRHACGDVLQVVRDGRAARGLKNLC